ncbi:50S ribosomal protein L11 [Candidatus Bathyarchaeota archaeon ex4484_135]|nr:MAG: 50S ribosomal protein L11 [Candidatus Bathyarchaeota archaeon ex4484_135]
MGEKKSFKFLIEGGRATAGPPIGPSLGPLGVNLPMVVAKINELTKDYAGMRVPVEVIIDVDTKEFEVKVGIPTTSALIIKELGAEKGSGATGHEFIGSLTMEQVVRIAKIKRPQLLAKTLKAAVKEILGTCVSMGVLVEGKHPKEVIKEVDEGLWDHLLSEEAGEGGE